MLRKLLGLVCISPLFAAIGLLLYNDTGRKIACLVAVCILCTFMISTGFDLLLTDKKEPKL
jgi:hypothetical protein